MFSRRTRGRRSSPETLEKRTMLTTIADLLIHRGAEWRYLDDGSDQGVEGDGAAWFADPNYNDASWASGAAELGYGDGDENTVVAFVDADPGTPQVERNATTYFRRTFDVTSNTADFDYTVYLEYDDAAAVYLNGVEILRTDNLAPDARFDDYATSSVPEEGVAFDFPLSPEGKAALVPGENVIAVEIHQSSGSSSDISFDLEFIGQTPTSMGVESSVVASGLQRPVYMTSPDGDSDRLFIIEQGGTIQVLDLTSGTLQATPFLDISNRVMSSQNGGGNEQGLLGLAFPPDFAAKNYFYVNYTAQNGNGDTVVSRIHLSGNPNFADPNSEEILVQVNQPQRNHNAGWIDFGPDGYLYIAHGDGGGANDTQNRAQTTQGEPLGKMWRIDTESPPPAGATYAIPADNPFVAQAGFDDEIWAYGLRNPWRNSFDRETGDLYIADVGQNALEEVNVQAATSAGGENYGWRVMEGTRCNRPGDATPCDDPIFVDPVFEYGRPVTPDGERIFEGASITGGYVYRGPVAELNGHYFFGDFVTSRIWSFKYENDLATQPIDWTSQLIPAGQGAGVSSFGEDNAGNLYFSDFAGNIRRVELPTDSFAVSQVLINADATDPPDLPGEGRQPSSWAQQRSTLSSIEVRFNREIGSLTATDLVLTNLGLDAENEPDTVVQLSEDNVAITGQSLIVSNFATPLANGVYQLQILATATDSDGNALDGNGDTIPGDPYTLVGNTDNNFYVLRADFNADKGTSIFDLPTFSYWFGFQVGVAPEYADLNSDTGVSIFDFPVFADNFGFSVSFPPVARPALIDEAVSEWAQQDPQLPLLPAQARPLESVLNDVLWDWGTLRKGEEAARFG